MRIFKNSSHYILASLLWALPFVLVTAQSAQARVPICRESVTSTELVVLKKDTVDLGQKFRSSQLTQRFEDPETMLISKEIPVATQNVEFLFDSVDAFQKRIFALTGETLPVEVIQNSDMNYKMSFRNAPKLDVILLTTLYARYDFTTTYLAKALEYHAKRGTKIIFGSSKSIIDLEDLKSYANKGIIEATVQKDINFMNHLREMGADVHLLSLHEANPKRFSKFKAYLRAMHAKTLAIYSSTNSANNHVFMGGRNVSDSYYLTKCPNLTACPHLLQYDTDYKWMTVADFDVSVRDRNFSRQVIEDISTLLPENSYQSLGTLLKKYTSQESRSEHNEVAGAAKSARVRNFVSLASKDLEKLYVNAINMASKSIRILTPYFNPTKEIIKAIHNARARNVKIVLVSNFTMHGDDFPPAIVEAIESFNQMGANRVSKSVELRTWNQPDLFHPKVVQIDQDTMMVTSVNVNNRSFTKDVENGMIIESPELVMQFEKTIYEEKILPNTILIEELKNPKWYHRVLYKVFGSMF